MMNSPGFWGANFNPQQAAQQWGQGLTSALGSTPGTAQDYGKGLVAALLGGSQGLSMMPEQIQQRAQDWFGIGAPAAAANAGATTPAASASPAATQPQTFPARAQQLAARFSQFGNRVR